MNNRNEDFLNNMQDLCSGEQMPDNELFSTGNFPDGWVSLYLNLLTENRVYWQNLEKWPRALMYCFYRVGFHVGFAYQEWSKNTNQVNIKTEQELTKVRLFTEAFIAGDATSSWIL